MNPGDFNRTIKLDTLTSTVDSRGGRVNVVSGTVVVPAKLEFAGGGRKSGSLEGYESKYNFTIRYIPDLSPELNRVVFEGQNYDILFVEGIGLRHYLKLHCTRQTHTGNAI